MNEYTSIPYFSIKRQLWQKKLKQRGIIYLKIVIFQIVNIIISKQKGLIGDFS